MSAEQSAIGSHDAITIIALSRSVEIAVNRSGLTQAQFRALWLVEAGMTSSSILARFLDVRPPTVTTVMNGMVDAGWVRRRRDPDDRRRVDYVLTGAGVAVLEAGRVAAAEHLADLVDELGDAERGVAVAGLARWREALERRRTRGRDGTPR